MYLIAVISKQIKMRNDSIAEFTKANRTDLIEQTKKEIEVLEMNEMCISLKKTFGYGQQ